MTVTPPATGQPNPQDPAPPIAVIPAPPPALVPPAPPPAQQVLPIAATSPAQTEVPGLDDDDRRDGIDVTDNRVAVPVSAFKRIKERAATSAAASARKDAEETMLRELGVESLDAAKALITKSKETPAMTAVPPVVPPPAPETLVTPPPAPVIVAPPPVAPPPPAPEDRSLPAATREKLRAEREAAELAKTRAEADTKTAREALAAKDLEIAALAESQRLREGLIIAGAADVDYTYTLLQRHLKSIEKDEAKLKEFDLAKWAAETKAAKPFLFGASIAPANTGGAGGAPPVPGPGVIAAGAGAGGARDFRTMTDAERKAALPPGIKLPAGSRARKT